MGVAIGLFYYQPTALPLTLPYVLSVQLYSPFGLGPH